jgi:hypothetical protein
MRSHRRWRVLGTVVALSICAAACSRASDASEQQAALGNAAYCTNGQIDRCGNMMKTCIDTCYKTYTDDDYQNCVNASDGCRGKYDACKFPCP